MVMTPSGSVHHEVYRFETNKQTNSDQKTGELDAIPLHMAVRWHGLPTVRSAVDKQLDRRRIGVDPVGEVRFALDV
jgi:hypothetical protein